jgi:hypothetical protein
MKRLAVLLAVAILVSVLLVPAVWAQGITWTSGFQVQNLSASDASITIHYYNQDGTEAIPAVGDTVGAMGSKTYFPIHAADGFNGSVVIESGTPDLVAIANTLGNSPQYAASTESFAQGGTPFKLPLIMRNNGGYYTWFNVQNVGTAPASVSVQYIPGSSGTAYTSPSVTIQPNAAHTFDQHDMSEIGSTFVGSAVVTSDQPIVATVMQVGETYRNMMGYNGFAGGSMTVSMPLVMANNSGYYTGFQVQNVGTASGTVTVDYGTNIAGSFTPTSETVTLAPDASHTFLQAGGQWTGTYVGSATISATQDVVAIVNQVNLTGTALGTAYNGFDPAGATNKVSGPLIMANNSGYFTGFQVMNVGSSATSITCTYGPNSAGSFAPAAESGSINPGDSYNSIQSGGAWGSNTYVGSVVCEAGAGAKIVMIVNQINPSAAGDQFMTYGGFSF